MQISVQRSNMPSGRGAAVCARRERADTWKLSQKSIFVSRYGDGFTITEPKGCSEAKDESRDPC